MNVGKADEDKATPACVEALVTERPQPTNELIPDPALPPNSKPVVRSLGAERMRLYRERRRKRLRCLWIELREIEIELLIRRGLLLGEKRNDRRAIRQAVYDFLEEMTLN